MNCYSTAIDKANELRGKLTSPPGRPTSAYTLATVKETPAVVDMEVDAPPQKPYNYWHPYEASCAGTQPADINEMRDY